MSNRFFLPILNQASLSSAPRLACLAFSLVFLTPKHLCSFPLITEGFGKHI